MAKRLDLPEVQAHAWIKGSIHQPSELPEIMRNRLDLYTKIRNRELQEKMAKHRWEHKLSMPSFLGPQMELFSFEKALHTDSMYSRYMAECADINARLDKQKLLLAEGKYPGHSESLSDDQVNSASLSDDSFKEGKESQEGEEGSGKGGMAEVPLPGRRSEDE